MLDAVAASGGPSRAGLAGQSIGAAAVPRAALDRPDRTSGVILAHSLGGLRDAELTALVKADRARAGELLPGARVEIVPGAPHSMYWETPALFNDAVARFLKDVATA